MKKCYSSLPWWGRLSFLYLPGFVMRVITLSRDTFREHHPCILMKKSPDLPTCYAAYTDLFVHHGLVE